MAAMNQALLVDEGDYWSVGMGGLPVTRSGTEWALTLHSSAEQGEFELRVENSFSFSGGGEEPREFDPEHGAAALSEVLVVEQMSFKCVIAGKDGTLKVDFHEGATIVVPPSDEYESWMVTGPRGMHLICMPGGDVAVWSPRAD